MPEEAEHVAGMAVAKVVLMASVTGAAPVGTTLIQLKMYRSRGTMLEEDGVGGNSDVFRSWSMCRDLHQASKDGDVRHNRPQCGIQRVGQSLCM